MSDSSRRLRLRRADRQQPVARPATIDELIGPTHMARRVWAFAQSQDLSPFYDEIRSVEGGRGNAAIDPLILFSLWLFATIEGITSARALDRLTREHDAFRWLCGGVEVNYHTLSDFQSRNAEKLDGLLTGSIASLVSHDAAIRAAVAQDGVRVRASAGAASFRRRESLEKKQQQLDDEPEPVGETSRQTAARQRSLRERRERVAAALEKMPEAEARKPTKDKENARVSTTDPEANVMKMADGGYRPAYNAQFVTALQGRLIVAVGISTRSSDMGELKRMALDVQERYGIRPQQWLVDGGFTKLEDIEELAREGITVYAPVPKPKGPRDPAKALPSDSESIQSWRERMGTAAAKAIYRFRAATAEWANAQARNHGLTQLRLRGVDKVKSVFLLHALATNLKTMLRLGMWR